ncbi:transcriptional regulator, LysR family [Rhodopseudomonas palustris HaA2]|uniref:Transcriptional regulator, LysR family n=1 Tax=Rhodopseudomonas palustris (strain HaA2) TaxID=316058 RepID=Q2J1L3_RHOP2|nr:LysR family transcriptional regulator [Rhodopseudomonas palustris]ABD05647.1 transcriptional regulator, LysR family [Rhodopseudomonas palustris HaA2]
MTVARSAQQRRSPRRTAEHVAKTQRKIRYDWNDVVYFLEVARQRSLVRAAAKLKVDHTTVSRRIRELERSLNSTLFKRSKSGFSLTEIGMRLLQYAEGMESQANAIVEAIGTDTADAGGAVRIAAMEGIGSFYLTPCIVDFNKIYPSIQIELITDTRLLDLSRREADIFVSFFRPHGKRLSIKKVGEFRISLYASNRYFEGRSEPRTQKELEDHAFIDFIEDHIYSKENRWLSDVLRPPHTIFRSTSLVAQSIAVSAGQGIAMLPTYVASGRSELRPVMPELFTTRDIWLSVHEDLLHIARIKAVITFLEERIEADRTFLNSVKNRPGRRRP